MTELEKKLTAERDEARKLAAMNAESMEFAGAMAKKNADELEVERARVAQLREALGSLVAVTGPQNVTVRQTWEDAKATLSTSSDAWLREKLEQRKEEIEDQRDAWWHGVLRGETDPAHASEVSAQEIAQHDAQVTAKAREDERAAMWGDQENVKRVLSGQPVAYVFSQSGMETHDTGTAAKAIADRNEWPCEMCEATLGDLLKSDADSPGPTGGWWVCGKCWNKGLAEVTAKARAGGVEQARQAFEDWAESNDSTDFNYDAYRARLRSLAVSGETAPPPKIGDNGQPLLLANSSEPPGAPKLETAPDPAKMCRDVAPMLVAARVRAGDPMPWCHLPKGHEGPHQCGPDRWETAPTPAAPTEKAGPLMTSATAHNFTVFWCVACGNRKVHVLEGVCDICAAPTEKKP